MKISIHEVDDLLERVGSWMDSIFDGLPELDSVRSRGVRVNKGKGFVTIEVDLPGVLLEDVSISVDGGTLGVKWSRKRPAGTTDGEHLFSISKSADVPNISAKLSHGVLTLTVPSVKEDAGSPHTVKVSPG